MRIDSRHKNPSLPPANQGVSAEASAGKATLPKSSGPRPVFEERSSFHAQAARSGAPWGHVGRPTTPASPESFWGTGAARWGQGGSQAPQIKAIQGPSSAEAAKLPTDLQSKVGTLDYYKARAADFEKRNPGMSPPDYYLGYGDKYAHRFQEETKPKLSTEGQAWVDRTMEALQQKIEDKRKEDPIAFAQLERDPEAFKEFAYSTHPDAYVESGLSKLPPSDLAKIATTPDLKDLLTRDGISQIVETGVRVAKQWAGNVLGKIGRWLGF